MDPYLYKYQSNVINSGELHIEVNVTNVTCEGMAAMRFKAVRPYFSDNDFRLEIDIRLPKMLIYGLYEASGTFLGFHVSSKGMKNISCTIKLNLNAGSRFAIVANA